MSAPNLFRHAPREVHQDALVAYLFDWLRPSAPQVLQAAAKDVISCLLGTEVEGTEHVETQWRNIDVFSRVNAADGKKLAVVVENKTSTTEHSDQLRRYRGITEKAHPDHHFVGIYLKTGWVEPRDRQASSEAGYRMLDRELWLDILMPHRGVDAVLDQYIEYLTERDRWFRDRLRELDDPEAANQALWHVHVQWRLMTRLFPDSADALCWGTNRGGTSWVQRHIAQVDLGLGRWETLFWRIDHRKPRQGTQPTAYVALRAFETFDREDPEARRAKVERLNAYRETFAEVLSWARDEGCPLVPGREVGDRSGNFESEVATFFVGENRVEDLVEWVPRISERFGKFWLT